MSTTVKVVAGDVTDFATPALVVNLFEGVTQPGGATGAVDRALDGAITALIADGEIKGRLGELTLVHTLGRIPRDASGGGRTGQTGGFRCRQRPTVSGDVARFLRRKRISEFATIAHGAGIGGLGRGRERSGHRRGHAAGPVTGSTLTAATETARTRAKRATASTLLPSLNATRGAWTHWRREHRWGRRWRSPPCWRETW